MSVDEVIRIFCPKTVRYYDSKLFISWTENSFKEVEKKFSEVNLKTVRDIWFEDGCLQIWA